MAEKTFHNIFDHIKERLINSFSNYHSVFVSIDRHVLEIRYYNEEYFKFAIKAIRGIIVKADIAESVVWCLEDDLDNYIPCEYQRDNKRAGIFSGRDETGEIQIIDGHVLSGADYITNEYYQIRNTKKNISDYFYAHPLYPTFSIWAKRNGGYLVHGAVVGKNESGVLIGAYGGAGKSTLSVAWMLKGYKIVGDDNVILKRTDSLTASKLYTSVGLNADMAERLNITMEPFHYHNQRNKYFYDASDYNFADSLKVKALIFPSFSPERKNQPVINQVPSGKLMAQVIRSTIALVGENHNKELVIELAELMRGIPTYEILLSRDIDQNVECLERLIDELSVQ